METIHEDIGDLAPADSGTVEGWKEVMNEHEIVKELDNIYDILYRVYRETRDERIDDVLNRLLILVDEIKDEEPRSDIDPYELIKKYFDDRRARGENV